MSGSGDIPMAVEAIKNGALDFIQKPFKGSAIVKRVREAIRRRRHGARSPPFRRRCISPAASRSAAASRRC